MFNIETFPVSPGLILGVAVYAAVSAIVLGPEMAERSIAKSNWQHICQTDLKADLEATRTPQKIVSEVPDVGGLLCGFYPEMQQLCDIIPDPNQMSRDLNRQTQALESEQIARSASHVADQCSCAVAVYTEEERFDLAVWAGTGRLVTPGSVDRRIPALKQALNSPVCTWGTDQ